MAWGDGLLSPAVLNRVDEKPRTNPEPIVSNGTIPTVRLGYAPLHDPREPLRERLRVGWEFAIQNLGFIQEQVCGILSERLLVFTEVRQGNNESRAAG